jgi:hypothetical protein
LTDSLWAPDPGAGRFSASIADHHRNPSAVRQPKSHHDGRSGGLNGVRPITAPRIPGGHRDRPAARPLFLIRTRSGPS